MKKVLVLDGSTRKQGNTSILIDHFLNGAKISSNQIEHVIAKDLEIDYCNGCLRCNLIKRCSITGDDWANLSQKIAEADILVFASPIYFHYVTAPLKKIIDRFRSFVHVQITEQSVKHTPWQKWNKDFVLLLSMGSSDDSDAQPVIDLFEYMKDVMGEENRLHAIKATRLAVIRQITKNEIELNQLYKKLGIPEHLAKTDVDKNQNILKECYDLGVLLSK
ncbi:MAG: flavodoxin family protein [Bacteroidales bacterium]|jgi:multimeric flavodoxin WrbA|nr:flavodoxin family protein [Bacteroidales bacterium]